MGLADIAWGNLRRTAGRTAFLLLVVAAGVATVTGMFGLTGAMRRAVGDAFDQIGANILILPRAGRRFSYAGVALPAAAVKEQYLAEASTEAVRSIRNRDSIAVVAPKLLALVRSQDGPVMAVGVRFPAELRLKRWWRIRVARAVGGQAPQDSDTGYAPAHPVPSVLPTQVLLGARVAERWQKDVGDTVYLDGRAFQVAGVIDPVGSDEDRAVWMDLGVLQELSGKRGRVSFIEVAALCNSCPIDEIVSQISEKIPGAQVTAIKEAVAARRAVVDRFGRFALALAATAAGFGFLAVALVLLGGVKERTRQIGIMRALGFGQRQVLAVFYLEAGLVGLAGGAAGSVLGGAVARLTGPSLAGVKLPTSVDPLLLVGGVAGAVLMALLACTVPAWQGARVDPARTLRFL
ncbi:MAG: ABC transporter permease [Bacillota bacterium]|nr:ABC transporter permease [Bacillota bacterium]